MKSGRAAAFFAEYEFKRWEKSLMAAASLLFFLAAYLFFSNYPLRRYLFNLDDEGHGQPVGTVSISRGGLRRQFTGEAEFKSIALSDALYDEDTLVTGPDAGATLKLDDGSTIEMAPGTMVKIHFSNHLTFGGISRAATVDVVAGSVKPSDEAKVTVNKPLRPVIVPRPVIKAPPPADTILVKGVELITPRAGTQLALEPGAPALEKKVTFTWRVSPPDRHVVVVLHRTAPGGARSVVFQQPADDHAGQGTIDWTLKSPGAYEWEIRGPKGEPLPGVRTRTSASFTLDPYFEGIEPLEPLVGGELLSSSRLNGRQLKNFDITLRWKPYPGAGSYRIAVRTQAKGGRPVIDRTVRQPQYLFNKDRVYTGEIFYEILAPVAGGFIARSPVRPFVFTFLAPAPVVPPNHAIITRERLESEGDSILITWQKTNFTEWYELEIARDKDFKTVIQKDRLRENFFVFKSPAAAQYFWRVRSSSKGVVSPFSLPSDMTVKR